MHQVKVSAFPLKDVEGELYLGECIEEVAMKGGGYLLWGGCAAGDTAAALVLKIG